MLYDYWQKWISTSFRRICIYMPWVLNKILPPSCSGYCLHGLSIAIGKCFSVCDDSSNVSHMDKLNLEFHCFLYFIPYDCNVCIYCQLHKITKLIQTHNIQNTWNEAYLKFAESGGCFSLIGWFKSIFKPFFISRSYWEYVFAPDCSFQVSTFVRYRTIIDRDCKTVLTIKLSVGVNSQVSRL